MIRGNADSGPDYIRKSLEAGRALLWVVWNGKDLMAAATTEIVNLDTVGKVCLITSCAGRDLRKWEKFLVDIEAYATTEGCDAVRFYGRPGWAHFLKKNGYDQPWFVMQKSLR